MLATDSISRRSGSTHPRWPDALGRWATGQRASEAAVSSIVGFAFGYSALASALLAFSLVGSDAPGIEAELGAWFAVGHYRFSWVLLGDRLSLPFACFSSGLVWVIAAFSQRYLHREDGFHRFYLMLAFFGAGVLLVALAGSLDLIFFGWEIVGLTSALLIAFFHERRKPVEHGLRAFLTYRFCDIGLLSAAILLHHAVGHSHLGASATISQWATLPTPDPRVGLGVGLLLLWASMGKAAQVPLGGWLPRAMEGPTPSSAIFYGAISRFSARLACCTITTTWNRRWARRFRGVAAISSVSCLRRSSPGSIGRHSSAATSIRSWSTGW